MLIINSGGYIVDLAVVIDGVVFEAVLVRNVLQLVLVLPFLIFQVVDLLLTLFGVLLHCRLQLLLFLAHSLVLLVEESRALDRFLVPICNSLSARLRRQLSQ